MSDRVAQLASDLSLEVGDHGVLVDGLDATSEIRSHAVTAAVSAVAANSAVRAELVRRQREWANQRGGGVLEGRDIGSVVFPDAELKLYLTAAPRVRAERRVAEAVATSTRSPLPSNDATAPTLPAPTARWSRPTARSW